MTLFAMIYKRICKTAALTAAVLLSMALAFDFHKSEYKGQEPYLNKKKTLKLHKYVIQSI